MNKGILVLVSAASLLLFGGCAENAFEPRENIPPETGLALLGDSLATTIYQVELKWWGSDPDGEVYGFHYRWVPAPGAPTFDLDTAWTYTALVRMTFVLPVPDSLASYRFEVRSLDNQGAEDATPAAQEYPFYNDRPTVEIRFPELLPDSAWPVLALGWEANDRQGDATIAEHLVWVKGREGRPIEIPGDADTLLLLPADLDTFGAVTVFLQTVDEAHSASAADSFNVFLYKVQGEILLVDDYPLTTNPVVDPDTFYRSFLTARVGAEGFTLLDVARTPFDTNLRFAGFLTAFDHVVWYTGNRQRSALTDEQRFDQMAMADSGLGAFLKHGGNVFLESLNGVGTFGGLGEGFPSRYMGFDQLYVNPITGGTNFEFLPVIPPVLAPCLVPFRAVEGTGLPDLYLHCPIQYAGIDSPVDTSDGFLAERLYRVPLGTFKNQPGDFYPAVRYDLPDPEGRLVLCTFPFSLYYGDPGNNDEVLTAFLDWLGAP